MHDSSCSETGLVTLGRSCQLAQTPGFPSPPGIQWGYMPSNQESLCPSVVEMSSSATLGGSVHLQHTTTVITEWSLWSLKLLGTGAAAAFGSYKGLYLHWLQLGLSSRSQSKKPSCATGHSGVKQTATLSHRDTFSFAFAELLKNAYVCPGSWFR